MNNNPVIVIGMHRSGTTMITEVLKLLGIYMGKRVDINQESIFFQKINNWIMHSMRASWDYPNNTNVIYSDQQVFNNYINYISNVLNSINAIEFFGIKKYITGSFSQNNLQWGWKDPRNTFTLPIWSSIFKNCKIIHVKRHGVDIANSLHVRNEKIKSANRSKNKFKYRYSNQGFLQSPRCLSLQGAFDIWYDYMAQTEYIKDLVKLPIHHLAYENFLSNPMKEIEEICEYLAIDSNRIRWENISEFEFNVSRAFAFKKQKELMDFAGKNIDKLNQFGYSQDQRLQS